MWCATRFGPRSNSIPVVNLLPSIEGHGLPAAPLCWQHADLRFLSIICFSGSVETYLCVYQRRWSCVVDVFKPVTTEHHEDWDPLEYNRSPCSAAAALPPLVGPIQIAPDTVVVQELGIYLDSDTRLYEVTRSQDCRPVLRYCVSCGASVAQCPDLSSMIHPWCRLSSSLDWTIMQLWTAYHRIFCHGSSQWWTPLLGSSFLLRGSTTSLRSFASSTGWRLQRDCFQVCRPRIQMPSRVCTVRRASSMNCVKWRTSRLVSDSVLKH